MELRHLRQANALTLFSGEKQRLCLAMAVKPEVILLDEPTSSLDPHNVIQVEKIISTSSSPVSESTLTWPSHIEGL